MASWEASSEIHAPLDIIHPTAAQLENTRTLIPVRSVVQQIN